MACYPILVVSIVAIVLYMKVTWWRQQQKMLVASCQIVLWPSHLYYKPILDFLRQDTTTGASIGSLLPCWKANMDRVVSIWTWGFKVVIVWLPISLSIRYKRDIYDAVCPWPSRAQKGAARTPARAGTSTRRYYQWHKDYNKFFSMLAAATMSYKARSTNTGWSDSQYLQN